MEKRFVGAELVGLTEKGFAEVELEECFVPNRVCPKFTAVLTLGASPFDAALLFSPRLSSSATLVILTPRSTLTLPCFRLHVFRRHVNTYKRLSWPGKNPGRSPFNCSSKTMRSLHTLHFANAAGGGVVGSSQVCEERR